MEPIEKKWRGCGNGGGYVKRKRDKCEKWIKPRWGTGWRQCNGRGNYRLHGHKICFRHYGAAHSKEMSKAVFEKWINERG